jgi:DNA (cytosine-5)-methyltransferase 1
VDEAVADVESETGAQVIVNGLVRTLWYYLRLLKEPALVLPNYQALLEKDPDVRPALKEAWNTILNGEYQRKKSQPV